MTVIEEVVRQHWKQILRRFQKTLIDQDDIHGVISHFQQAVTLLTDEVANHNRPGPVLLYFIAESILDTFFVWSLSCPEHASELKYHQLRCFECLLNRSQHEVLFHKQIFKPLLNLLRSCESSLSLERIEKHMIVVLNQVCVSITRSPELLGFCFDISAEHGPSRFVIFSLLIPFVHRDGIAGQQARDALLLIMQLSHRNESIARYIVDHTNFCPILATGLSALYSDLPHRLATQSDEWFVLTKKEWSENAALVQFMNSLQFCNDVIQIAHPTIGHHLLQYIYHGFLVPVLGPSIYQDLHEIPVKFTELQQFSNTMDEVIAATAYLDLFLRTIHEPLLLKVFLKFILCAKIDEISLLDTLIQRIHASTKLGLVSLGLFYTLINLNCEDMMYRLVFMYLIPCRHVMCSQRRHITDVDMYGRNAERFLSLRLSFVKKNNTIDSDHSKRTRVSFEQKGQSFNQIERHECTFGAYLEDAHFSIARCRAACRAWTVPYDGETPCPDATMDDLDLLSLASSVSSMHLDHPYGKRFDSVLTGTLPTSNHTPSIDFGKRLPISNDSGIHDDDYSLADVKPRLTAESFKLPAWLANNQPIPDELLAQRPLAGQSSCPRAHSDEHDDEEATRYHPSSFYAFSFIDLSGSGEDTWSVHSSDGASPATAQIGDEIKSCVETLQTCLTQFRQMNEPPSTVDPSDDEETRAIISNLCNELLDRIDKTMERKSLHENLPFDLQLLDELFSKTLTFNEYLAILDRLVDSNLLEVSSKTGEELANDILTLAQQIEQYRTLLITDDPMNIDRDHPFLLSNIQSNYSSLSFLQHSPSMDMSVFVANDLSAQPSNFASSIPLANGTAADVGPFLRTIFFKLENMLQNSLQVNLLLTGIVARLAHYSQPLLRSLLLNHSVVLETNVKSLFQILSNLKVKLETISQTFNDFHSLIRVAQETMYQRETTAKEFDEMHKQLRSPSHSRSKSADPSKERMSKRSRILDFFRGRSRATEQADMNGTDHEQSQVILVDKTSMKFTHNRDSHPTIPPTNEWDDPRTRNLAYCAVVFNEFLKELTAITLEHSVQQYDDDDDLLLSSVLF